MLVVVTIRTKSFEKVFRVSGFGFRVSGFGFRVSGFGFRVSGLALSLTIRLAYSSWGCPLVTFRYVSPL